MRKILNSKYGKTTMDKHADIPMMELSLNDDSMSLSTILCNKDSLNFANCS